MLVFFFIRSTRYGVSVMFPVTVPRDIRLNCAFVKQTVRFDSNRHVQTDANQLQNKRFFWIMPVMRNFLQYFLFFYTNGKWVEMKKNLYFFYDYLNAV